MFARAAGATAFFQRVVQVRVRSAKRGNDAEENSCEQRNSSSEKEDVAVDADVCCARQLDRQHFYRAARCNLCDEQAERASSDRHQHAFDK